MAFFKVAASAAASPRRVLRNGSAHGAAAAVPVEVLGEGAPSRASFAQARRAPPGS